MALIEVPLNSYRYSFRRLSWQEESRISFPKGEDQRKILLSFAMVDISGLLVTQEQALEVLKLVPEPLLWRIWLIYRGNLPAERYYSSGGLYEAPDQMAYSKKIYEEAEQTAEIADAATAQLESRFGRSEVGEAESISRQMFRKAQEAGSLVPAGATATR